MGYKLNFGLLHKYDQAKSGIDVDLELSSGGRVAPLSAKLDTGASCCIFKRDYAEILLLDLAKGQECWFTTASGRFLTYGHEVTLSVFDFVTYTMVYFAADENFKRNVLGRQGWLDRFRIGIIDYKGELYVSRYDDDLRWS